jgi:hypothetical protein
LDLQISLLAEHESARVVKLMDAIAQHLGVVRGAVPVVQEAKHEVDTAKVMEAIERYDVETAAVSPFEAHHSSEPPEGGNRAHRRTR